MPATSKIEIKYGDKFLLAAKDLNVANATPGNTYRSLRAVCYMGNDCLVSLDIDDLETFHDFEHWQGGHLLQEIVTADALNVAYFGRFDQSANERELSLSEYVSNHKWIPIDSYTYNPSSLFLDLDFPM